MDVTFMIAQDHKHKLAAFLSDDVVGYSRLEVV
jgi:hypothetical protein